MRRPATSVVGAETSCAAVHVVRLSGRFDLEVGARLLRVIDARLVPRRHDTLLLLVDLTDVTSMGAGAIATLRHARYACACRSVRLALIGANRPLPPPAPKDRSELIGHLRFPTVAVAIEVWTAHSRAVPPSDRGGRAGTSPVRRIRR